MVYRRRQGRHEFPDNGCKGIRFGVHPWGETVKAPLHPLRRYIFLSLSQEVICLQLLTLGISFRKDHMLRRCKPLHSIYDCKLLHPEPAHLNRCIENIEVIVCQTVFCADLRLICADLNAFYDDLTAVYDDLNVVYDHLTLAGDDLSCNHARARISDPAITSGPLAIGWAHERLRVGAKLTSIRKSERNHYWTL